MYSSSVIISVPFQSVVLGRRQAGGAMTTQGGFPCVGGAPEARSTANFDDHLSRDSLIADKDLIDMVLIAELAWFEATKLREVINRLFAARATHLAPQELPPPPAN